MVALIGAVKSGIASLYYGTIIREVGMKPDPDGDTTPVGTPGSLCRAMAISSVATLISGILPGVPTLFGDIA